MSAGPARRLALDRNCVAALVILVALRTAEWACLGAEVFAAAAGDLTKLFFLTTSSNLAAFALVPLVILLGAPVLRLVASPQVLLRVGGGRQCVWLCLRVILLRSVLFSAVTVVTGLLLIAVKDLWGFGLSAAASFLAMEAVLMALFCTACQLVMLAAWLLSSSLPAAVCLAAGYGTLDYLASFSPVLDNPAFYLGWRLTLLEAGMPVGTMAANALRLLAISGLLALACVRAIGGREVLPRGGEADVS